MEPIHLTVDEIEALVKRAESGSLQEGDAYIIRTMGDAVKTFSQAVNDKSVSIKKLLAMVFGQRLKKLIFFVKLVFDFHYGRNRCYVPTAIFDRLLHHSTVINIKGNSYSLKGKMVKFDKQDL